MTDGFKISETVVRQMQEMWRKLQHLQAALETGQISVRHVTNVRWLRLIEDMTEPAGFNSPTTAAAKLQIKGANGDYVDDTTQPDQEVTNRMPGVTRPDGTTLLCVKVGSEWTPIAGGCSA